MVITLTLAAALAREGSMLGLTTPQTQLTAAHGEGQGRGKVQRRSNLEEKAD